MFSTNSFILCRAIRLHLFSHKAIKHRNAGKEKLFTHTKRYRAEIRPECFKNSCFLTFLDFLSIPCLPLQLDVARYACVTKAVNQLDNKISLGSHDRFGFNDKDNVRQGSIFFSFKNEINFFKRTRSEILKIIIDFWFN